jgi:signal transduction histidine kinase
VGDGRINIEITGVADGVQVRVIDNGRGIPESVRDKLFEPFVSSGKENGTGLGLTVVQKIIQDHGGDVGVEKTSSEGTIFRLTLPLSSESMGDGERENRLVFSPVPSARKTPVE